jgi:stearoyl-CoA desaturase (delta-9 desaturase)
MIPSLAVENSLYFNMLCIYLGLENIIGRDRDSLVVLVEAIQNRQFIPGSLTGVLFIHTLALAAPFTFSRPGLLAFLVMVYVTSSPGITLGYHRLLSHRSFKTPKALTYLFTFLGCLAIQGGPIRWVATHRLHHKEADIPPDPHTPKHGFLWAHLLWNFYKHPALKTTEDLKRFAPELYNDPVMRFFDRYFFVLYIICALLFLMVGTIFNGWKLGLSLVIWGFALRTVYVWHVTWLVNSAAHLWGYQTYKTTDNSRNNWWVALLSFGEGWHNNHHAHPRSAKMGFAWYEIDMSYWIIVLLKITGCATEVVTGPPLLKPLNAE